MRRGKERCESNPGENKGEERGKKIMPGEGHQGAERTNGGRGLKAGMKERREGSERDVGRRAPLLCDP